MAYVITELCQHCGSCAKSCPTDTIFHVDDNADWPTYYIYSENCIGCGTCEAVCEVGAPFSENALPSEHEGAVQQAREFFESDLGKNF